jgi:membrane dipeptidase
MAGLNYHVQFLRSDGERNTDSPISVMAGHIDYLAEKVGVDCVGPGSDFDGAIMPQELQDAAGLPRLMEDLANRGYGDAELTKIAHANWVRILRETWGD